MSDLVTGVDGLLRPAWADVDQLHRDYYDNEWGNPVTDETGVFERLSLEAFQAGLSWSLILRRRPRFRELFCGFEVDRVAAFDQSDVDRLLTESGIIRNRAKIEATIRNASKTIVLRDQGGLVDLVWSYRPKVQPRPRSMSEIKIRPEALALATDLRKRGFSFVGPTTMQSLMEAIGIINHHLIGSHRRPR